MHVPAAWTGSAWERRTHGAQRGHRQTIARLCRVDHLGGGSQQVFAALKLLKASYFLCQAAPTLIIEVDRYIIFEREADRRFKSDAASLW
jgi:hypothetical protein